VAGRFYPREPDALEHLVESLLSGSGAPVAQSVIALLAPHAGFRYSGGVAGAVYREVRVPSRVILLGPNHTGYGPPLSLWDKGAWELPGARITVDESLARSLQECLPDLLPDEAAHRHEHALEVQLPFLRARRENLLITPIVVGVDRLEALQRLGQGMARVLRQLRDEFLLVISSDMTHYESAQVAWRKDHKAVSAMEAIDPEELHRVVMHEGISMCGIAPAVAGLTAARELGARKGRLIRYAHSGEVTGDHAAVVGYAGMVFW
jgi:AmmeMemoRadiSam system protein B